MNVDRLGRSQLQSFTGDADGGGMLAQTTTTTNALGGALLVVLVIELILIVAFVIAWVKILGKAGYSGAWALVGLVPIVNIVMFFVFAFSRWPVLNRPNGFSNAPPPFSPGGYQPPGYQPLGYQSPGYPAPGYQAPGYQPPGGYGAATWQTPAPPAPGRATPLNSTLPEPPAWHFGAPRDAAPSDPPPPPPPPPPV